MKPRVKVSHFFLHACPCGVLFIGDRADLFHSHACKKRATRRARTLDAHRENRATNIAIRARRNVDRTPSRPAPGIVERLKGALDD